MQSRDTDTIAGFRRQLIFRLAAAGVVWALLAGIAAYFIETERLEENLVDQAALEARNLEMELRDNVDGMSVETALDALIESHAATSRDFFILAELYDRDQKPLGESAVDSYEEVERRFDRSSHQFPQDGGAWYQKLSVDGHPYLQVMVPVGPQGNGGWFEGIYRIAPETVAAIEADIARITTLVMLAVLGTAAILYPLMAALHDTIVAKARDLLRANLDTLKVLGNAIAKRDSDTNAHNYRVTLYAVRMGEAMGLAAEDIRSLIKGAFLHDVGKIAVPDAILLKPGKLDEQEFARMKTHVTHGLDIIAGNGWLKDAAAVVGGHHEKVNGSGYPRGLAGEAIPLAARIFAVADVFDALTSERPYKKPMSVERTMAILEEGRGSHFDGRVLNAFIGLMPNLHAEITSLGDDGVEDLAGRVVGDYFRI